MFDDVDIQQRRSVRFQGVFQTLDGVLAGVLNAGIMRIMSVKMGA